jgi:multiple antibiotic resistance protein
MKQLILHAVTTFLAFFAVMNPVANTPLFLSLTSDVDSPTRKQIARDALLLTFVVIVAFCAAGRIVFELFGITMPAFKITGGLLVFLVGFQMLHGEPSRVHEPSEEDQASSRESALSVAVSPLAVPILAGPGTIATAMNFSSSGGMPELLLTTLCFLALCLLTYISFTLGERIIGYVGTAAINALTRIMGMVLAVIGTQMLIDGVTALVKSTN